MTIKDLYNVLESEIEAGRLTLESNVYFGYDIVCFGSIDTYNIEQGDLFLFENYDIK